MKRFLFLITCLLCLSASAQDARKVLDATASRIRKGGDTQVTFTATSFSGSTEQGRTEGTMLLKGRKMQMDTPTMKTWYDGKTLWSYMPESGEVNVTTPTEKEIAAMNPYSFLGTYKKGYKLSMKESTLRGHATYEVHMLARYAGNLVQEVYIDINKADYTPLCVRVKQDDNWSRIAIHQYKSGLDIPDAQFRFDASKHPEAEVIDLR